MNMKVVIIGLPGTHYSSTFMLSLIQALYTLWNSQKYKVILSPGESSFVPFARMKTLGLDTLRGDAQKPFNNANYDVFVTIDSDIIFTPQQLIDLIESTEIHPVVSGVYRMTDQTHIACVKEWDTAFFAKHGTFKFMTVEEYVDIKVMTQQKFVPVSYNGMGFFAIRKHVLDAMKYPYFQMDIETITTPSGNVLRAICSEDVSFCKAIVDAGYDVMIHTDLLVGHEKSVVL